jgi:uncharacterized protein
MQTSNTTDLIVDTQKEYEYQTTDQQIDADHNRGFVYALTSLVVFASIGIWIMQNSVNAYYEQTYHAESPLRILDDYIFWQKGAEIGVLFNEKRDESEQYIGSMNHNVVANFNQDYAYTVEHKKYLAEKARIEKIRLAKEAKEQERQSLIKGFTLTQEDEVFFAGDSMMQGVAPYVQKALLERFQIKTINLSKQSTGLSYPKFFDWPKTIKETIASNPHIKVMVIFLGPNDPWDMPNPQGGQYLRFESPEWEAVYRSRIADIIQTAQNHNVNVMWITPPNMKKPSLNEQMIYLNQIVADEVQKNKAFFIDSRPLLGDINNVYSDYLIKNGESIKMRSADGIHFSPEGQKIIANEVLQYLKVI